MRHAADQSLACQCSSCVCTYALTLRCCRPQSRPDLATVYCSSTSPPCVVAMVRSRSSGYFTLSPPQIVQDSDVKSVHLFYVIPSFSVPFIFSSIFSPFLLFMVNTKISILQTYCSNSFHFAPFKVLEIGRTYCILTMSISYSLYN